MDLITPVEALAFVLETIKPKPAIRVPLEQALGGFLAADVSSPVAMPLFDNSAMDGYAVRWDDVAAATAGAPVILKVQGIVAAGDNAAAASGHFVNPGEALRIFTGAMIPEGATAVIRQEDVTVDGDFVAIRNPGQPGANIRRAGEELQAGEIVLHQGDRVTPAAIGLLAGFGLREISVVQRPCVGCVVTGSELVRLGEALEPGQIYDSNTPMLVSALQYMDVAVGYRTRCDDNREDLALKIESALATCDLVIVSGGVSVGDFDFVKAAAADVGMEQIFWGVAQKPGKPFYFAADKARGKFLFGLPGNPGSALTCFYEYVKPALLQMMGCGRPQPFEFKGTLAGSVTKKAGLVHFLKGLSDCEGVVQILEHQGSHMMSSFARANCLAVIPADATDLRKGDKVPVHLISA